MLLYCDDDTENAFSLILLEPQNAFPNPLYGLRADPTVSNSLVSLTLPATSRAHSLSYRNPVFASNLLPEADSEETLYEVISEHRQN